MSNLTSCSACLLLKKPGVLGVWQIPAFVLLTVHACLQRWCPLRIVYVIKSVSLVQVYWNHPPHLHAVFQTSLFRESFPRETKWLKWSSFHLSVLLIHCFYCHLHWSGCQIGKIIFPPLPSPSWCVYACTLYIHVVQKDTCTCSVPIHIILARSCWLHDDRNGNVSAHFSAKTLMACYLHVMLL